MRLLATTIVALFLSGCALTVDKIDVPYQSAGAPAPVAGAAADTVAIAATDGRTTYRDRVGTKKNGYGMEMAAIVATNDIPQTVADAIRQNLAAQGYQIGADHARVGVEVVQFYNDFKMGFFSGDATAQVALMVKVTNPAGVVVYSKYYAATGTEPNIMMASGSNARAALIAALRNAVAAVIGDPQLQDALRAAQSVATAAKTS